VAGRAARSLLELNESHQARRFVRCSAVGWLFMAQKSRRDEMRLYRLPQNGLITLFRGNDDSTQRPQECGLFDVNPLKTEFLLSNI
jgi:hypothetical protein